MMIFTFANHKRYNAHYIRITYPLRPSESSPSAIIKGHRIVFRPDVELKKAVAMDFSLKRISSEAME